MSRIQLPSIAARKRARLRRQRGKETLMLVAVVLLMIASTVAYGFFLKFYYLGKLDSPRRPAADTPGMDQLKLNDPKMPAKGYMRFHRTCGWWEAQL